MRNVDAGRYDGRGNKVSVVGAVGPISGHFQAILQFPGLDPVRQY